MELIILTIIILFVLLGLLIPVGRYARKVGLAPRYWIMVNMVCWAACWLIFRWFLYPFYRISNYPLGSGIGLTVFLCLVSYLIVWFIIWKKGNKNLDSRIEEIGKKE